MIAPDSATGTTKPTGANAVQIDAALQVASHWADQIDFTDDRTATIDGWVEDVASDFLEALIPPGTVIADASRVIADAEIEALGRIVKYAARERGRYASRHVNRQIEENFSTYLPTDAERWQKEAEDDFDKWHADLASDLALLARLAGAGEGPS